MGETADPKSGVHPGVAISAAKPLEVYHAGCLRGSERSGLPDESPREVDGHVEALGDCSPHSFASVTHSAIVTPLDRHERDDVDGTESRMLAAVLTQIDGLEGDTVERQDRSLDRGGVPGQRKYRTVVRCVRRMVEQAGAGRGSYRLREALDDLGPTALADVRDRFDDGHATLL